VDQASLRRWFAPISVTAILLGVLLFLFPFGSGYTSLNSPLGLDLWSSWTRTSDLPDAHDYTYCLVALIFIVYLIFARQVEISRAQIRGSTGAILWIIGGLLLFWIGSRAGKQILGEAGIQILLLGAILWFWGGAVFRVLAFAWVFLVFLWPLAFLDSLVAFPLRMAVTDLSYHMLNAIGIPCMQHGTALLSAPDPAASLPLGSQFQIDIADPCSGLRSLFPMLMFSAIVGYFFLSRRWHQWMLFLSAFPAIIAGNVVRIILLVIGCTTLGMEVALGTTGNPSTYHEGCGFAVFVVVLILELLIASVLLSVERRRAKHTVGLDPESERRPNSAEGTDALARVKSHPTDVTWWRSGVVLGLAVAMLVVYALIPERYLPAQTGVIMNLPDQVALPGSNQEHFHGFPAPVSEVEQTMLPKDTEFARKNYDDFYGHQIFFSIVLSGQQQYSIHRPEVCLVAQGWHIGKAEDVPVRLASGHDLVTRALHIQREVLGDDGKTQTIQALYLYWYVAENMTTPSNLTRNLWSSWDRILHNRDHRWAYIAVMSAITQSMQVNGLNEDQTRKMLQEFISQVVPVIQKSEMPGYSAN
jgi:EpsI family protein